MTESKTPERLYVTRAQVSFRGPSLIELELRASPDAKGQRGVREFVAILTPAQANDIGLAMTAAAADAVTQ